MTACARDFSKSFVHPAGSRYLALFSAGEGHGGEEEEWHLTSVIPSPVQIGSLTAIFSQMIIG